VTDPEAMADAEWRSARLKAFLQGVFAALSGQSRRLLPFDAVREQLHIGGPVYRGVVSVPLDKVVGSVDRYRDFDRLFLPTQSHTEDRWRRVSRAWYEDVNLPPVQLYKVGEVYFVVDGNHRVSVARNRGQAFIDAEVRECEARVPLTSDVRPEDLARLGERVEFLERTQLDRVRPGALIEPTILGAYDRLLEHIAVHRYFMGVEAGREVSEADAVGHWYDTLYGPVAEVVEQSGILESLPGRTAADFYLWVMDHMHYLRERPGQERLDPGQAAQDFIENYGEG
jgi:hypothetical protein